MIDVVNENLISIAQAAERLGVTPKTIYVWASDRRGQRKLETIKFGGKRFTSLEALQRFGQENDTPPIAPRKKAVSEDYEREMQLLRDRHGF